MAYLSLYRKYRSQTFGEILGQEHVTRTLANAISEDRVAHAYLFTGPRGTGKTSTARILAKALNCVKGPTPEPCGECESCVAIANGSSLDVIEMDAASHSKVDETRDVLSGVPLATAGGRRKVYVIDEVHMLSAGSFNALLKTLEEPPPHVIFILATTEAHKVLPTIVSRTQRFDFRRIPADTLESHLAEISKLESIDIDPGAIAVLARHAEGSARDALSALDQLAGLGRHVTVDDAERLLGRRSEEALIDLFDAIAKGDLGAIFATSQMLVAQGIDFRQLAFEAMGHSRSLLLLKSSPESEELLDAAIEDRARLLTQAETFSGGALLRTMDLIGKAITEMRNAPNHRLLLEVALIRSAAPDTDPSAMGLLGRIERLERRIGIEPEGAAPVAARSSRAGDASGSALSTTAPAPQDAEEPSTTVPAPQDAEEPSTAIPAPQGAEEEASPVAAAEVGFAHFKDAWPTVVKEVNKRSKRVGAFLNPSRPVRFEGSTLIVEVQSEFHAQAMSQEANKELLSTAVHSALGAQPPLDFIEKDKAPVAAVAVEESVEDLPPEGESIEEADPVELVRKDLGAEIVEERNP
ncbi:MAG: DNA polymerase III subunit gamma/tau [Actinomycetota bacterium]